MKKRITWVLFALCLASVPVGLYHYAPLVAPVHPCSPADFWWAACRVSISDDQRHPDWVGTYPPRDGYFICYDQWYAGQYLCRVKEEAALAEFPKVVAKLDEQLKERGPTAAILQGYQAWAAEDPTRSDGRLLLRKVQEARYLRLRKDSPSSYRSVMEEEKAFDLRWERLQRYWLNIVFEFVYLGALVTFVFWPWLRAHALWRRCAHVALLPFLLMLPYFLGYAALTYGTLMFSGGVLYPMVIIWFRGDYCVWPWLLRAFPQPLDDFSHTFAPSLVTPGGWGPDVVACLLAGAVGGFAMFSIWTFAKRPHRPEHAAPEVPEARPQGGGEVQSEAAFWLDYRKGLLKISLTVLAAFLVALFLAFVGMFTIRPFNTAACAGDVRTLRFALALRPSLNRARDPYGNCALQLAVEVNEEEAVAALLKAGADPNIEAADGTSVVRSALGTVSTHMLEMLLSAGGDATRADGYGETPLHLAGSGEAAKVLLQHGAKVDARTSDGLTPLHYAAFGSGPALVEVLTANGASLEARDRWGRTPLHVAAGPGRGTLVSQLPKHGADPNARTSDGRTPLHFAAERASQETVEALLVHGADVNAVTAGGQTPLDLVHEEVKQPIRDLLLKHGAKEGKTLSAERGR